MATATLVYGEWCVNQASNPVLSLSEMRQGGLALVRSLFRMHACRAKGGMSDARAMLSGL